MEPEKKDTDTEEEENKNTEAYETASPTVSHTSNAKLSLAVRLVSEAEALLSQAVKLLSEVGSGAAVPDRHAVALTVSDDGEGRVIEGVFDGQKMIGADGKPYSVPANYASN